MADTRTALVTGARRGIGRGIALALAQAGFDVVVNDLQADDAGREVVAEIEALGRRALLVPADIADLPAHDRLLQTATDAFGRIDCLVNNAGVSVLERGDLLDASVESYDRCLNVNLRGPFFLTQKMARHMLQTPDVPGRSIVTITSVSAELISVERGEYCIAKTGLSMLSRLFAVRLAPHGIGVFEVRPGIIRTDMTAVAAQRLDAMIAAGVAPIARWGEPADVGKAVATVATGGLPFSAGQVVYVDGGLILPRL
jgi:NAD(P)-dependent dehydrogenase (short-subunit alcohol dehydrogenase family)